MSTNIEKLIKLIQRNDSFHKAENEELNDIFTNLEPEQIPSEYRKDVISIIDMMFLTGNVLSGNRACFENIHEFLMRKVNLCSKI